MRKITCKKIVIFDVLGKKDFRRQMCNLQAIGNYDYHYRLLKKHSEVFVYYWQ